MPVDHQVLGELPLFDGLESSELEELCMHLQPTEYPPGEEIIREGYEVGEALYVLLHGSVEVVKRGLDGRGHIISSLTAPTVFGELELLSGRKAVASVTAVTAVKAAILSRGAFDEMCAANRSAALKVIRNLAKVLAYRLAATDGRLAAHFDLSIPGSDEKLDQVRGIIYASWGGDG